MHLEPFGSLTKLGAKRAELVQKFVPWSRIGIFYNERTRSTPLDPKVTFWCVSYYLCASRTVWLHYETRCTTGRTSAKVRATKPRRNFSQRTHPINPIGPKNHVLVLFVVFGCILDFFRYCMKLVAKRAELMHIRKTSCHELASEFLATNAPDPPH